MLKGKLCLFSSFMMGAAAGYMYHDYAVSSQKHGLRKEFVPVLLIPRGLMKKAKKMKREMKDLWEDMH